MQNWYTKTPWPFPQHASVAPSSCDLRCQVGILSVWCCPAGFVHPRHLFKFLTLRPPKAEGLRHNARSSAVGRFLTTSVISVTSPYSVPAHFAMVFTFLPSSLFPFIPCEALHIVYADHSPCLFLNNLVSPSLSPFILRHSSVTTLALLNLTS